MTTSVKDKTKDLRQVMFYLAAVFLTIGIALVIGWSIRGTNLADYRGIGQAKVFDVKSEQRIRRIGIENRYRFILRVTAGSSVFECTEIRESLNGWKKGDVLPIVYNIKNPKEFALNMTPEELFRWNHTMGIIAVLVLLVGATCLFVGFRLKRPAGRRQDHDSYQPGNGE